MTTGRRDCSPGCQAGCPQTSHDTVIRKLIPQQQARESPTVSVPHMDPKSLFLLPALRQAGGGPFWCPLRWEDTSEQKARGHQGNLTTRTLGCLSQPCLPMGVTWAQGCHPSILPLGLTLPNPAAPKLPLLSGGTPRGPQPGKWPSLMTHSTPEGSCISSCPPWIHLDSS